MNVRIVVFVLPATAPIPRTPPILVGSGVPCKVICDVEGDAKHVKLHATMMAEQAVDTFIRAQ